MRLPSLQYLSKNAFHTLYRFPLAILLAVTATIFAMLVTQMNSRMETHYWYLNSIASSYLGMLLSVALTVVSEKKQLARGTRIGFQVAAGILTILFYGSLPDHYEARVVIRYFLLALALHWLIAVIGFSAGEVNGFWQYNKKLFLRILTSLLYTTVLQTGIALALLAIEHLLGVHIESNLYGDVWCFLVGIFNTWFFLAGFPAELENPVAITDYPKGLKIFTQYVLLPLITIYLLILYAYLFKIIFTAHWPSGWVAYLVLGLAVTGILALLLVYPLRGDESNKWISTFSRFFYFALFPLIVLLCCAIWKRVNAYGITELRYFVLLLAAWLVFIAIYFLASAKKDIRLIPLSLCLIAFLSCFGPWGAFSVSLRSQQSRLKALLIKNDLFSNGKVRTAGNVDNARKIVAVNSATPKISLADRKTISSAMSYIENMHGYRVLQPWFNQNLDSLIAHDSIDGRWHERDRAEVLVKLMGVRYASEYETEDNSGERFYVHQDTDDRLIPANGAAYLIRAFDATAMGTDNSFCDTHRLGKDTLRICLDSSSGRLIFSWAAPVTSGSPERVDSTLALDLGPLERVLKDSSINQINQDDILSTERASLYVANSQWSYQVVLTEAEGEKKDSLIRFSSVKGYILLSKIK